VLASLRGTSESHLHGNSVDQPLSTISAGGTHHAIIGANLITIGYGERAGQQPRAQAIQAPLGTVVGAHKHALVAVHLTHLKYHGEQGLACAFFEQANGGFYEGDGHPADAPLSTITSAGSNQRLVSAYLVKYFSNGGQWQKADEPLHTILTKGRMGLVQSIQVPAADGLSLEHRTRARLCASMLHEYLPEHFPERVEMVLIQHEGHWWVLVDITLRMLRARELYRAQGFPDSYQIDEIPDPQLLFRDGVQVSDPLSVPRVALSGTDQIRMCGNSVCPPLAKAIVEANYSECGLEVDAVKVALPGQHQNA
jgi:DNA (cytosine-5)-methyltransferase 1